MKLIKYLKFKLKPWKKLEVSFIIFILILIFTSIFIININNHEDLNEDTKNYNKKEETYKIPKTSSLVGEINLTNYQINNTSHFHNETVQIEGRIYSLSPLGVGVPGLNVSLLMNGIPYPVFNDTTDSDGNFTIDLIIPFKANIYSNHKIEVNITDDLGVNFYEPKNYFMLTFNATSFFDIDSYNQNIPQLIGAGSTYNIPGFLRYDNSSVIPSQRIDSTWYNESFDKILSNAPIFTNNDGSFQSIPMPDDNNNISNILHLNLTYTGIPEINGTQKLLSIKIFRNITCEWNVVASATEGNQITISGNIFSRKSRDLVINFTDVRITRNGASIGTTTTSATGNFTLIYTFPLGTAGPNIIEVELWDESTIYSNITHFISVAVAPPPPAGGIGDDDDDDTPAPYQNFFMVLIPIIIGGVAGFLIYAYFFLKKQKEKSLRVKVPLEGRIINLKILKDTGRMEEALSYLFQSIYLELINAKYGRIKQATETIRDFAIISVKELNLNPASIYPFIQNVEKIIYDKPFIITEEDFYTAIDLFSPVYFELTGYNFILNF